MTCLLADGQVGKAEHVHNGAECRLVNLELLHEFAAVTVKQVQGSEAADCADRLNDELNWRALNARTQILHASQVSQRGPHHQENSHDSSCVVEVPQFSPVKSLAPPNAR